MYWHMLSVVPRLLPRLTCFLTTSVVASLHTAATMQNIATAVRDIFDVSIRRAFPEQEARAIVAIPKDVKFGNYQCNSAMAMFQALKGQPGAVKNPREVAQRIVNNLQDTSGLIDKTEVSGPGFVSVFLSPAFMAEKIHAIAVGGVTVPLPLRKRKVVVDFSAPNIAKEMHVGHLRSTILGDTISRLLEFQGHDVVRVNHIGDWGTQFGMLIRHLKDSYPHLAETMPDISDLQAFYKESKKRFDEDPTFKKAAQEEVVKLQSGDEQTRMAWQLICDISRCEFKKIYDRLNVKLIERGESFYNAMIPGVLKELDEKNLTTMDDGALCVFVPNRKVPLMVRKRDGGYNYDSTDITAVRHRIFEEKADWIIYVTDLGQQDHFDLVFDTAKLLGWYTSEKRMDHVGFGVVLGEDGKRLKTRAGETVRLVDMLDSARDKARALIVAKQEESATQGKTDGQLTEIEIDHAAEVIGYGAVKYADLKCLRTGDYKYSEEKMLNMKGNTAVYMMYAYCRIASMVRKAGVEVQAIGESSRITLDHPRERMLAALLLRFPEVLDTINDKLTPHVLCEFLYEVAETFSEFYRDCRVLSDDVTVQNSRLLLCAATAQIIKRGLELLGIEVLPRL